MAEWNSLLRASSNKRSLFAYGPTVCCVALLPALSGSPTPALGEWDRECTVTWDSPAAGQPLRAEDRREAMGEIASDAGLSHRHAAW